MHELNRTVPSRRGIDGAGIVDFLDDLEGRGVELHSMMMMRGEDVVAEGWWTPYSPNRVHLLYSLSKTFTASCVGMLVDEGRVGLDTPVINYLPYLNPGSVGEKCSRVTVRHCLTMATGHEIDAIRFGALRDPVAGPDPEVLRIFREEPEGEPGSVFCYNQRATYLLGAVVREVTGSSLLDFARRRLFDPLGIGEVRWHVTAEGNELGFSGLHAATEAIARLGLLWLNRGTFCGQRLLSEAWLEQATNFLPLSNPDAGGPDWAQGYGFQVWNSRHGYRGDGAFGQFMVILPEQDTVVAITAETESMQEVLDALWFHVLPALSRAGTDAADAVLANYLARLALPAKGSEVSPLNSGMWPRVAGDLPQAWGDVSVVRSGQNWELRFTGIEGAVEVGDGTWVESQLEHAGRVLPLAASGGWGKSGFTCWIRAIESPHRFEVTPVAGGVSVQWQSMPLGGPDPFLLAASITG